MVRSHVRPQMVDLIQKLRSVVFEKGFNLSGHWTKDSKLTDDENVLASDLYEIFLAEKIDGGDGSQTLKVTIEDLEEASKNMSSLDWQ